jgi:hypothetical protein
LRLIEVVRFERQRDAQEMYGFLPSSEQAQHPGQPDAVTGGGGLKVIGLAQVVLGLLQCAQILDDESPEESVRPGMARFALQQGAQWWLGLAATRIVCETTRIIEQHGVVLRVKRRHALQEDTDGGAVPGLPAQAREQGQTTQVSGYFTEYAPRGGLGLMRSAGLQIRMRRLQRV